MPGKRTYNFRKAIGPVTLGFSFTVLLPFIFLASEHNVSMFIPVALWGIYIVRFKGVIIDHESGRIKVFQTLLFFKLGKWRPMREFPFYMIKLLVGGSMLSSKVGEMSYESRASGLVIYDKKNKKEVLLQKGNIEQLKTLAVLLEELGVQRKENKFKKHTKTV